MGKNKLIIPLTVLAFLFVSACATRVPTSDTTPPEITVTVSEGRGNKIFRSTDGEYPAGENCIKVPGTPTQLSVIFGDSGGVNIASIKVFPATIIPGSIEVTPASPEATYTIRTERRADMLDIDLEPASDGTVRTGATAVFEINGNLPIAVTASAADYSGNVSHLSQFDLRSLDDLVICRGDR